MKSTRTSPGLRGVEIRRPAGAERRAFHDICKEQGRWMEDWHEGSLIFVAVHNRELIGGIREWITCDGRSTLVDLWVREDARGRRLGHGLVHGILAAIPANTVYLDCVASLRTYYEDLGFRVVDRRLFCDILEEWELPGSIVMAHDKNARP